MVLAWMIATLTFLSRAEALLSENHQSGESVVRRTSRLPQQPKATDRVLDADELKEEQDDETLEVPWKTFAVDPSEVTIKLSSDHRPPRRGLMYSEMRKTGSGTLRRLLPQLVKDCAIPSNWSIFPKDGKQDVGCYGTTGANLHVSKEDQDTHFVIGSVREPCDWYVSFFGYKSTSDQIQIHPEDMKYRGVLDLPPDQFNDKLMELVPIGSAVTALASFGHDQGFESHVDCWVDTGNMSGTLKGCLTKFEAQGGNIDWENPFLNELINGAYANEDKNGAHANADKNSPVNNQLLHHKACSEYFDTKAAAYIEKVDAPLYKAFGWAGCCKGVYG